MWMSSSTSTNCTSPWCLSGVFHWQILTNTCSAWLYFHILPLNGATTSLIMPPPHDSFLPACSCPVLGLHSGLQPFQVVIVELEHYLAQAIFVYSCLQNLSIAIASATIDAGGTALGAFFTTAEFLLPRTSFSFVYPFLLSSMCLFLQKNLAYIYSFPLSVYTVFDVSYLTLLEHKLSCLFIAFCAVLFRITSFLSSSLKHSLRFDAHTNHLVCTNDISQALPSNAWWKPFACDTSWISLVWRCFWSALGILQRLLQASTPSGIYSRYCASKSNRIWPSLSFSSTLRAMSKPFCWHLGSLLVCIRKIPKLLMSHIQRRTLISDTKSDT